MQGKGCHSPTSDDKETEQLYNDLGEHEKELLVSQDLNRVLAEAQCVPPL